MVIPTANAASQFVFLGLVSVALNTMADGLVTFVHDRVRNGMMERLTLVRRLREMSGAGTIALGVSRLLVRRRSTSLWVDICMRN